MCLVQRMVTQLVLYLTQQGMMTVLALCKQIVHVSLAHVSPEFCHSDHLLQAHLQLR